MTKDYTINELKFNQILAKIYLNIKNKLLFYT